MLDSLYVHNILLNTILLFIFNINNFLYDAQLKVSGTLWLIFIKLLADY